MYRESNQYALIRASDEAFQQWAISFFKGSRWADFATERMEAFVAKQRGEAYSSEKFPSLGFARYTNPYRMLDRGSQYVITEIANNTELGWKGRMTLLFLYRQFNMPSTYELFRDGVLAPMMDARGVTLDELMDSRESVQAVAEACIRYHKVLEERGVTLYSRAYLRSGSSSYTRYFELMPEILDTLFMLRDEAHYSLLDVFALIHQYEGFGAFLAYQLALDVNYCFRHSKSVDFVIPGPGAINGLTDVAGPMSTRERMAVLKVLALPHVQKAVLPEFQYPSFVMADGSTKEWLLEENDIQNLFCEYSKMYSLDVMGSRPKRFYVHSPGTEMSVVLPYGFVARESFRS